MASGKFTLAERDEIEKSIAEAEKNTSGEIRLFVEDVCGDNVLDRAAYIFNELKMHNTKDRNGVLIYLALESKHFAIIGDAGINSKVHKDFWHEIKLEMQHYFTEGDFVKGLNNGIRMSGEALGKYFPLQHDDKDELPNEIVFGKKK
ncbi:MAG TPA: TPM domain-containing protein [Bacteroidia bacterium]|nr:TPM domain-containing protein [Bacteroidia bacterium]